MPRTAGPADPSERYVLPDDAAYVRNLSVLWAHDPALAAALEAIDDDDAYPVEPAKDGELTLSVPGPGDRRAYLHSRYRPLDEAARLVHAVGAEEHLVYHVYGLGLGYHLQMLFDRAGREAVFFVFEPDLRLLRTTLFARDLSAAIDSRRVLFFTRPDKGDLFARLAPHSSLITLGTLDVHHPASVQRDPAFHGQMQSWLAEYASFARTNINTLVMNGRRTLENIARNLGRYANTPCPSRLKDAYKGCPAIVVSAGPSLRKNKHLLKALKGRAVIIAVQTTYQPLVEMGVEPDFVTALDYHDICTRFFERLPKGLATELVAEPKASPAIFALNPGPLTVTGNEWSESLLREMKLEKTPLPAGSTVAHLAFYLAEHLGCDPILLVGQDLGFSDGLYYAPGTSYEDVWRPELGRFCTVEMKQWEQIVRERPILRKIPDQQGRPMYTEERLFTYLQHFERDFLNSKRRIIDCTEGGAAKLGTTVMTLADAAEAFCQAALPTARSLETQPVADRGAECVASLSLRRTEAVEIERISRETLPLLEELRDHVDDGERVNALIARIDPLRDRMNALGQTYDLVAQLTQGTEMERFRADRRISAARVSGVDLQRRQVARDIDNVVGVMNAALDFQRLMDEVIDQLGGRPAGVAA